MRTLQNASPGDGDEVADDAVAVTVPAIAAAATMTMKGSWHVHVVTRLPAGS